MTREVTNGGLTLQENKTFDDEVCYLSHTNYIYTFLPGVSSNAA